MGPAVKKENSTYEKWFKLPSYAAGKIIDSGLHTSSIPSPKHANARIAVFGEITAPCNSVRTELATLWL